MPKLSQLSSNTLLLVETLEMFELRLMSKDEFLEAREYREATKDRTLCPDVWIAEENTPQFRVREWLSIIDDTGSVPEDWKDDVLHDLTDEDISAVESIMNKAINENPTYMEGESVEIDIWPENEGGAA